MSNSNLYLLGDKYVFRSLEDGIYRTIENSNSYLFYRDWLHENERANELPFKYSPNQNQFTDEELKPFIGKLYIWLDDKTPFQGTIFQCTNFTSQDITLKSEKGETINSASAPYKKDGLYWKYQLWGVGTENTDPDIQIKNMILNLSDNNSDETLVMSSTNLALIKEKIEVAKKLQEFYKTLPEHTKSDKHLDQIYLDVGKLLCSDNI